MDGAALDALKDELRARTRDARRSLSVIDRARASARCVARLVTVPEVANARTIGLYAALSDEADPFDAVDYLAARGAKVLLPRVAGDMVELVQIGHPAGMQRGFQGVLEPIGAAEPLEQLDAVIVPGLAFDLSGGRLGQGGGHYDRLLAALPPTTVRIGLCLQIQLVDAVPRGSDDEVIDIVVTDEGATRTGARPLPAPPPQPEDRVE